MVAPLPPGQLSPALSPTSCSVSMRSDGGGKGQTLSAKNCGAVYCKSSLQCKCCQSWLRGERERGKVKDEGKDPGTPLSLLCLLSCLIIKCEKCLHTFRLSVTLMKSRRQQRRSRAGDAKLASIFALFCTFLLFTP